MVKIRLDAKWSIHDKWTPSCFIMYWSGIQVVGLYGTQHIIWPFEIQTSIRFGIQMFLVFKWLAFRSPLNINVLAKNCIKDRIFLISFVASVLLQVLFCKPVSCLHHRDWKFLELLFGRQSEERTSGKSKTWLPVDVDLINSHDDSAELMSLIRT